MNKAYKYTLTANERKEITFDVGVNRLAISNANGTDGDTTIVTSEITKTDSGEICSFVDGADAPFADFIVNIEAVQSGSGDPSPTNVRPITGWTGANILVRGINLWDEEWELGTFNEGLPVVSDAIVRSKNFIPCKPNVSYYINKRTDSVVYFYDKSFNVIEYTGTGAYNKGYSGNSPFVVPNNAYYLKFRLIATYGTTYKNDVCINVSSSENGTYKPYDSNSETININWQSTAGTVYGGTLDVKTGVLTVTHVIDDRPQDLAWSEYQYINGVFTVNIDNKKNGRINIISNKLVTYDGSVTNIPDLNFSGANNNSRVYVRFDAYTGNLSGFKTEIADGYVFVYELATPVTYQLTPTEVRSLLGVNNVWADCGPVNVRYFVQSTQPMIDYVDDKTPVFFDAVEDLGTYDVSLVGATSTDIKNYLLSHKNANIVIRVKRYSTIMLYYLREYSPNYFAEFATQAVIFDAEGTKSMRINYLRLDLTQETSDFTDDYIILPTA